MRGLGSNAPLIQLLLVFLFVVVTQIMRARRRSGSPKPAPESDAGKAPQPGDLLREMLLKSPGRAREPRSDLSLPVERFQISEPSQEVRQPPKIGPESALFPSFLLLALFGCLCALAYRYWAR
jgi:hypothetical protein